GSAELSSGGERVLLQAECENLRILGHVCGRVRSAVGPMPELLLTAHAERLRLLRVLLDTGRTDDGVAGLRKPARHRKLQPEDARRSDQVQALHAGPVMPEPLRHV